MLDEEVREALESLNRKRTWLLRATEKFPDLCVYRWDDGPRYCSASINASVDEFEIVAIVDRSPYHDHPPEQNVGVWCYRDFEGEPIYSWPPKFVIGHLDDDGPRYLYEHWRTQLRDAGIPSALIARIANKTATCEIEPANDGWVSGDPDYDVWSAQDNNGEVIGVVRIHERVNFEAKCAMRTRAEALGIRFVMHDGGHTIETAHDLQLFIDDTVVYMQERDADREDEAASNDQQEAA